MSDDKFRMVPTPDKASDSLIEKLFEGEFQIAKSVNSAFERLTDIMHKPPEKPLWDDGPVLPTLVPELFFSTTKRRLPDIYECRNCDHQFPQEVACPECNSTNIRLCMHAPSRSEVRQHSMDRESALTELDPEWRERFHGDAERAWEFYEAPQTRLVGLGKADQPPEVIDEPYRDPDDIDFDSGLDDDPR